MSQIFDEDNFNIIRVEGLYIFRGPAEIGLIKDSEEHLEYLELYKDIQKVQIRINQFYNIDL